MSENAFDLVVIGSGPGGYVAAIRAGQLGLKTAVIEEDKIGGVCLNVGCIPSKSLIYASGLVDKIRHADDMGLLVGKVDVDGKKLQEWKNGIVNRLTTGVGFLLSKNGVTTIHGHAEFKDKNTLTVTSKDEKKDVSFKKCIVATGARAATLPFLPIGGNVMTYREALDIDWVPESFTVIGGGVIGLELGTVFQRLGSKLTVIELTDSLLPGTDADLVKVVEKSIKKLKGKIHKKTGASGIEKKGDKLVVKAKDAKGKELAIDSEVVLVAIGFKPNSDKINAQAAGLKIDDTGHFVVNESRQTNVPHIYAIGDVAGLPWLGPQGEQGRHRGGRARRGEEQRVRRAGDARCHVHVPGGRNRRHPGARGHGAEARREGRQVPVHGTGSGAVRRRDGRIRQDHRRCQDGRGARRVGRGVPGIGSDRRSGARHRDGRHVRGHRTDRPTPIRPWPESLMEAAEAVHGHAIHILNG